MNIWGPKAKPVVVTITVEMSILSEVCPSCFKVFKVGEKGKKLRNDRKEDWILKKMMSDNEAAAYHSCQKCQS